MQSIETTEEEKCIAVVACAFGFISVFVAIRSHGAHLRAFFLHFYDRLRRSCRCVNLIHKQQDLGDDTYQRYVENQVQQKRRTMTRKFYWYLLFLNNLSLGSLMYNMMLGRPRWMNTTSGWFSLAYELLLLIFLCCDELSNKVPLNLHYLNFQTLVALFVSPWGADSQQVMLRSIMGFALISAPTTSIPTHCCAVVLFQGFALALMMYRSYTEDLGAGCGNIFLSQTEERTSTFISACFVVIAVGAFSLFEALMRYQVTSNIREKNSETQLSAASSLLDLTCDAVVELDQCLRMKSHSPKLSAMLLRTGTTLEGLPFSDLLGPDSERVNQLLRAHGEDTATPSAATTAHIFQTHLVDSSGNRFCTEVFQVKYTLTDGQKCHTLGLRSLEDQEALVRRMVGDSATVARSFQVHEMHEANGQAKDEVSPLSRRFSFSMSSRASRSSRSSRSSDSLRQSWPEMLQPGLPGPLPSALPAEKDCFIDIDVVSKLVNAATAPFGSLAGQEISSIFSPYTIALLERVCEEERRAIEMAESSTETMDWPNRLVFFKQMPFYADQLVLEISGKMKVSRTRMGAYHVIVCFTRSLPLPQSSVPSHQTAL